MQKVMGIIDLRLEVRKNKNKDNKNSRKKNNHHQGQ